MELDEDADYVYLNLGGSLSGSNYTGPTPAVFALAPQAGIVSQQAARYFAVSRVTVIGARTLPAFCAPIDVRRYGAAALPANTYAARLAASKNFTTLGMRLRWQDYSGAVAPGVAGATGYNDATLTWAPQNAVSNASVRPQSAVDGYDVSSDYYFAQDVQWVVDLVNSTVTTLWADFLAGPHADKPLGNWVPVLTYDGITNLFTWNVPAVVTAGATTWAWDADGAWFSAFSGGAGPRVAVSLVFNDALAALLANFPFVRSPTESAAPWSGSFYIPPTHAVPDLRLRMYQAAFAVPISGTGLPVARYFVNGTPGTAPPVTYLYWSLVQTAISTDVWSPVAALVLEAAGLHNVREIAVPPGRPGIDGSANVTTFTESSGVADIVVNSERATDPQGMVIFAPPFHRWVSLEGGALPSLKIFLKWRSVFDGVLRPVMFVPGSSASMKLVLRARALGAGN